MKNKFGLLVASLLIGTTMVSCSEEEEPIENNKVNKKSGVEIVLSTKTVGDSVIYTYEHIAYKSDVVVSRHTFNDTLPLLNDTIIKGEKKKKEYIFYVTVK